MGDGTTFCARVVVALADPFRNLPSQRNAEFCTVVFADFAMVVANYGEAASWDGGALTYGATVSFADFALLVSNYGKQAITSGAGAISTAVPSSQSTPAPAPTGTPMTVVDAHSVIRHRMPLHARRRR
jgi:hypothetical protein